MHFLYPSAPNRKLSMNQNFSPLVKAFEFTVLQGGLYPKCLTDNGFYDIVSKMGQHYQVQEQWTGLPKNCEIFQKCIELKKSKEDKVDDQIDSNISQK